MDNYEKATIEKATIAIVHPDSTVDILPFDTFANQFFDDHPSYKRYVDKDCKCPKDAENTCRFELCGAEGQMTISQGGTYLAKWRSQCPERIDTDISIEREAFTATTFQQKWTTVYILTSNIQGGKTQYRDVRGSMVHIRLRTLLDIPQQYWTWRFWFEMQLRYYAASWFGIQW